MKRRHGINPEKNFSKTNKTQYLKEKISAQKIFKISKKIEILINKRDKIMIQDKIIEKSKPNSRIRTLIQIGRLVEKSSLLKTFEIELGEDLQSNLDENNKASSLLNFLIYSKDHFLENEEFLRNKLKITENKTGEKLLK